MIRSPVASINEGQWPNCVQNTQCFLNVQSSYVSTHVRLFVIITSGILSGIFFFLSFSIFSPQWKQTNYQVINLKTVICSSRNFIERQNDEGKLISRSKIEFAVYYWLINFRFQINNLLYCNFMNLINLLKIVWFSLIKSNVIYCCCTSFNCYRLISLKIKFLLLFNYNLI